MPGQIDGAARGDRRGPVRGRTFQRRRGLAGREEQRAWNGRPREDLVRLVDGREPAAEARDALGAPQQQVAGLVQGVVEGRQDPPLQRRIEVDEDVSAAHQIQLRKWRIAGQVVLDEDAQIANRLVDPVAAIGLDEVATAALFAHGPQRAVRVDAGAGLGDGGLAEIRPEDLDRVGRVAQDLEQRDAERIDLFAGRASGHPDADRCPGRLLLDDGRKDLPLQGVEDLRVAEERRDVDEDVFVKRPDFIGVPLEQRQVVLELVRSAQGHPAGQSALEGRPLVLREVDADGGTDHRQDPAHQHFAALRPRLRFDRRPRRQVRMAAQAHQLRRQLGDGQDAVDHAGVHRAARHLGEFGRCGVLDQRDAVLCLDGPKALRAVRSSPGQDHADGVAAARRGQRAKKQIDRQVRPLLVARAGHQRQQPVLHRDVGVGRNDVDVVPLHGRSVRRLTDRHRRGLGQRLGQEAGVRRIEVLDQHERHAGVGRKILEELCERLQPPRRGAYSDDGKFLEAATGVCAR